MQNTGAGAWVFTRTRSTWTQQRALGVGGNVALSADGDTALIGTLYGGTVIFTMSHSAWKWTTTLPRTGAVALAADGSTAIIGGPATRYDRIGAAWIYRRRGKTWSQSAAGQLTGAGEVGDGMFGSYVALSAHGNTALIGGPSDGPTGAHVGGAVWTFVDQPRSQHRGSRSR